tara:strand:- start:471 stop:1619 length:1149 start_codon:yes stop_codon:yes gene_type:complete
MKKILILSLLISFCGGTTDTEPVTIEETSVEDSEETSESQNENEKEVAESKETSNEDTTEADEETSNGDIAVSANKILWGATNAKPEVYAAADVSQATVNLTVEWVNKAIGYWGSYGPLEIWIVGTGKDEVIALDEKWCEVRSTKDPNWNKEWDCANGDPYESGDGWSPFYGYINDGGAAVSSYIRDHLGYYFNALIMSSKYPGPEEEDYKPVILHEYFHVYQHGNLSIPELPDTDGDWRTSNRNVYFNGGEVQVPFLMEGGAEYMAQYWYSREAGVDAGYLKRVMEYKAEAIKPYFNTGKSLRELGYDEEFNSYDILAWFVAYLVYNTSEETFRVNFWTQIEDLGFEEAFKTNFGKSADDMIAEFDTWVAQPIDVLLEIIP